MRTGWRGEMRYGLLNDARVLDKDAWPLMVERYVALAYDKGVMRCAQRSAAAAAVAAAAGQAKGKNRRPATPLACPHERPIDRLLPWRGVRSGKTLAALSLC